MLHLFDKNLRDLPRVPNLKPISIHSNALYFSITTFSLVLNLVVDFINKSVDSFFLRISKVQLFTLKEAYPPEINLFWAPFSCSPHCNKYCWAHWSEPDGIWSFQQQHVSLKPMKMDTHTFSGYVFTVKRSRKRQWFHFPLCSLRCRGGSPVFCLWIIHLVGQTNWWSPSGPNLQNNPPQEASSYREASVPGSTDLGLLVEGLPSQERHSQQGIVGGRKQAQG